MKPLGPIPNSVPSPLSGGSVPGKMEESWNYHPTPCSGKPIHGKPIHIRNGADVAPSKDRALLIIQGMVQLCKSVGSLCLAAASPGTWGCLEPTLLATRWKPPVCKGGMNPHGLGAQKVMPRVRSCPTQDDTPSC